MRLLKSGLVVALLFAASTAQGQEPAAPKTYSVTVGIGKYHDALIEPRPHAEADAKSLHELFTDPKYLGDEPADARLLIGADAGRAQILAALVDVVAKARAQDLVIFTFIGRGGPLGAANDRACYFAADSTVAGREHDAVASAEIGAALRNLKSRRFCAFLDVDFKGLENVTESFDAFFGADPDEPAIGRAVFLATNGLRPSLDLDRRGVFAQVVLESLAGAADTAGYEPDGAVTVPELEKHIQKNLTELARKHGRTIEEKEQQPFTLGSRGSDFILTSNPAVAVKHRERLDSFTALCKDNEFPAALAEEGRILLERMPNLENRRELRKEYQAFADGEFVLDGLKKRREAVLAKAKIDPRQADQFAGTVMEAVEIVQETHIKQVSVGEMARWAVRGLYRELEEPVPPDIEARLAADTLDERRMKRILTDARRQLGKREDLDRHRDVDITLRQMLQKFDRFTTYIAPKDFAETDAAIVGRFSGIGITIQKHFGTDRFVVLSPTKGSPAYKAGIEAGDIITTITRDVDSDGNSLSPLEVFDTKGPALNDVIKRIQGQAGTNVKLTVERDGRPMTFELTRADDIPIESVLGVKRKTDDEWEFIVDQEHKIGYVRLNQFQVNSAPDMERAMKSLANDGGIQGFILDLRFNSGGSLTAARDIAGLFLPADTTLVTLQSRRGPSGDLVGELSLSLVDFPMVILVNEYSASGSELVSAALQDRQRTWIVGERTRGKASVQGNIPFDGGLLKLTKAVYRGPSGKNLDKGSTGGKEEEEWGVMPDRIVKLTYKEKDNLYEWLKAAEICRRGKPPPEVSDFKDVQLDAALDYLREKIKSSAR